MSIARRSSLPLAAACATCLLIAGYAQAQQIQQPIQQPAAPGQFGNQDIRRTPSDQQQVDRRLDPSQSRTTHFRGPDAAGSTAANSADLSHYIANCLIIKNEAEIKANEFGEQRAENPKVKQFARQMIDDHRQLVEKLQQLTATDQAGAAVRASTNPSAQPVAGQTTGQQARHSSLGTNRQFARLLDLDRKITDQCGQLMQQQLADKTGVEFDRCFVGLQIGAHIHMLAALDVISQQTTGQLQQLAHEAKAKVQQHLEHAEQLEKELAAEAGGAGRQARS